jgi:hypothetical protein
MATKIKKAQTQKIVDSATANRATLYRAMMDIVSMTSNDQIRIPTAYREQVLAIKLLLRNDTSGLVNTLLDFAIDCALVDYSVETSNANLTALFNGWLSSINSDLRGQIPVGVNALAKQYFRERWKGSSFLLLRTVWEEKDGYTLPTKLWFVNGEDIAVSSDDETVAIGGEKYSIKVSKKEAKTLPASNNEMIFVQKPFESWGEEYPIPYLIRKGVFRNLKFLELLTTKGEYIVGKALEYLLMIKKGSEGLTLSNQPEFTYSKDDLQKVKDDLEALIQNRQGTGGVSTYATNFDTEVSHLIPEYSKAIAAELYAPIERRILAGLGMIDVVQGISSTRRESTLNPRPLIGEIEHGIEDFKALLTDIMYVAIEKNKIKHPKAVGKVNKIHSSPITHFITDDIRTQLRSMYDRGVISKQTYSETCGGVDFNIEVERTKNEKKRGLDVIMYPPVTQNQEATSDTPVDNQPDATTPDKKGPEAKNFKGSLPEDVKALPEEGQNLWMRVYIESSTNGDEFATKMAWTIAKKFYKKDENGWVKKSKTTDADGNIVKLENASSMMIDNIIKMKEIELKEKQSKLLSKLLKGDANENI